jgi:uncharacterized SAM-binding protein YcdF (DUF218 family)
MQNTAIVVLGAGVDQHGKLTELNRERVEIAARLLLKESSGLVIVSGGATGSSGVSEARAMSEHLKSMGIPATAILQEVNSKTTIGNAYYTKKLFLEPRHLRRIVLVTSGFHSKRASLVFRKVLGNDYEIECVQVSHDNVSPEILEREELLSQAFDAFLSDIKDGEDEKIMAIARSLGVE